MSPICPSLIFLNGHLFTLERCASTAALFVGNRGFRVIDVLYKDNFMVLLTILSNPFILSSWQASDEYPITNRRFYS